MATVLAPDETLCPYCGETIKAKAVLCRYCRSDLARPHGEVSGAGATTRARRHLAQVLLVAAMALVALARALPVGDSFLVGYLPRVVGAFAAPFLVGALPTYVLLKGGTRAEM